MTPQPDRTCCEHLADAPEALARAVRPREPVPDAGGAGPEEDPAPPIRDYFVRALPA